jgi:hypothetical protein
VSAHLTYNCRRCGFEIGDTEGFVYVQHSAVAKAAEGMAQWERNHPESEALTIAQLGEAPDPAPWRAAHTKCVEDIYEQDIYGMDVERLRQYRQVLDFVCHMSDKTWVKDTDLYDWARSLDGVEGSC